MIATIRAASCMVRGPFRSLSALAFAGPCLALARAFV
jgi:hypothetical protein